MKDSKQGELIEEESRWVESQILPPDVLLFILKDERTDFVQHCSKKGQHCTSTIGVEVPLLTAWSRIRGTPLPP